jgi:hypothetical protein
MCGIGLSSWFSLSRALANQVDSSPRPVETTPEAQTIRVSVVSSVEEAGIGLRCGLSKAESNEHQSQELKPMN